MRPSSSITRGLRDIPGPPRLPVIGNLPDFLRWQIWDYAATLRETYGPISIAWAANKPFVFVTDARTLERIWSDLSSFTRTDPIEAIKPIAGDHNPFHANGADWHRRRRASMFEDPRFETWLESAWDKAVNYVRSRPAPSKGLHANFENWLDRFVFDLMGYLIFGRQLEDAEYDALMQTLKTADVRMKSQAPLLLPGFTTARARWLSVSEQALRRARDHRTLEFLVDLLAARSLLPDAGIVSELANVHPGGSISGSIALAHALAHVSKDAALRQRIQNDSVLTKTSCTYREVIDSPIESLLRESLRLHPPVSVTLRSVAAPSARVGDFELPQGTSVVLCFDSAHRDACYGADAGTFRAERWTPEFRERHPYGSAHFFPFGRGPRACVGQEFALLVVRAALYGLLSQSSWTFDVEHPAEQVPFFGCRVPRGIRAKIGT